MASLEYIPVKNQKFDIGRTINPFNCDCKQCDFLHCPKNNYAVKMKRKSFTISDFFNNNREKILALNNPQEVGTIKSCTLELNYALIAELFDTMNFAFPKGTYWATDDYKWLADDVNETIYKEITIVKFSRKGKEITLGKVNIGDGKVFDIDLSQTQEKLANKISKALRELKDLILCVNKERKEV